MTLPEPAAKKKRENGESQHKRFLVKIKKNPKSKCWEWTACKKQNGYGAFLWDGIVGYAHRYSYHYYNGIIKNGLFVCHKCDNPSCVNPKHLWLGTAQDNSRDSSEKGRLSGHNRGNWPEYMKSHRHHWQVLSIDDIKPIRKLLSKGRTVRSIADDYGVSYLCIYQIKTGVRWGHVK